MPKIDPMTGCEVLTLGEFLAEEAAHEGKGRSGGELLAEMFTEIDNDARREEEYLRDPVKLLPRLLEAVTEERDALQGEDDAVLPPIPRRVLRVLSASVRFGTSKSEEHVACEAEVEDGSVWFFAIDHRSWAGSRMEPPDADTQLTCRRIEAEA